MATIKATIKAPKQLIGGFTKIYKAAQKLIFSDKLIVGILLKMYNCILYIGGDIIEDV